MRVFLASSMSGITKAQRQEIMQTHKPLYLLETFFNGTNKCLTVQNDVGVDNFLLDSGTYSFLNGQETTIKKMEPYVENYITHIKQNNVKYYFEMDVDSIFGLTNVERWRKKIENSTGKQSIPVWHKARGIDYYKRMVSEYNYIAIAGFANRELKRKEYPTVKKMVEYANAHNCKVHGLGFTNMQYIFDYPFYSVDSSSWTTGVARGGRLSRFINGKIVTKGLKNSNKLDLPKMSQYSFGEWVKFQKYMDLRR